MPPKLKIYETVLYADDLVAAESFYREILGLETLQTSDLFITLCCGHGYLLIFDRRKSEEEGRPVPSHGTTGPGHLAFAVDAADLDAWRRHLKDSNVAIRGRGRLEIRRPLNLLQGSRRQQPGNCPTGSLGIRILNRTNPVHLASSLAV